MSNLKPIRNIGSQSGNTRPLTGTAGQDPGAAGGGDAGLWYPPPLRNLEDAGLSMLAVGDHVLKILYARGDMLGMQIADSIKLPFSGVLDPVITFLKDEKFIEIVGSEGRLESAYRYQITERGMRRAADAMERSQYAGAAPVPLVTYIQSQHAQNRKKRLVREADMQRVMDNLIVSRDMLDKIGPAANSGTSIFLYGPPGNGKTTFAERIGRVILGEDMWIPYSIDVDGQIIQLYDQVNHELAEDQTPIRHGTGMMPDQRWVRIKRPIIIVGGELTMESLDLIYDPINKFYEAPYQVKANGGMFLIDDFGRQQVSPVQLLNRWIVPLEKKIDYMTLNNGRKIEIPFSLMVVFSTNLDPADLVDDAFLRRIKYKIEVGNPTHDQYRDLMQLMCRLMNVPFDQNGLVYLLKEWYLKQNRELRFVHPRDLLSQMKDISDYMGTELSLANRDLVDRAAASYFVDL